MSKGPEHTFLKRRHTKGQQEHEKMYNMTNYIMEMQIKTMSYHHTAVIIAIIKKTKSHVLMRVWRKGNPWVYIHTHTHTHTHTIDEQGPTYSTGNSTQLLTFFIIT